MCASHVQVLVKNVKHRQQIVKNAYKFRRLNHQKVNKKFYFLILQISKDRKFQFKEWFMSNIMRRWLLN